MIKGIAAIIAILGAVLVSNLSNEIRLIGFLLWIVSNGIWTYYGYKIKDFWVFFQFVIFLVISINGVITNM